MMRYVDMPTGDTLKIPHSWDLFVYQGQRYRCMNGLVYVWRDYGWYPCAMATLRVVA